MQPISEPRAVTMSVRCQDKGPRTSRCRHREQGMPFDATGFRDEGGDEPDEWHLPPRVLVALWSVDGSLVGRAGGVRENWGGHVAAGSGKHRTCRNRHFA